MIGQIISHYKILEKLGQGGMGVVFKAHDIRLDRDVALKFLPANAISSPEDVARFEQEAKAISALNHSNIATIYDVDEFKGNKFLVLEYIDGGTLKSKLKALTSEHKEFAVADVVDYGIQIAEGLAHAHRHQIVHRDIKSDNVMLTNEGKVKITDFGLAKLRGTTPLTRTGSILGTLAYMAPEQFRGEDSDYRADLFSLGVVLYEMATSRLPFRGEHEAALIYSIANEEPASAKSLRQNIPPALDAVITKCLAKDRALRYQNTDEIVANLRALQSETTGSVKPVVLKERSKVPWILAAAAVVVSAAALYLFLPAAHPSGPNSKTIAVLPFTNMNGNPEEEFFSDGITEDILTQLSKIADLKVISHTTMAQFKGSKKSLKEIGKELNAGVILEGSVRSAEGQIRIVAQLIDANSDEHLWADTYDREYKQIFAIQSDIAKKIASSLQAKLSAAERERLANPGITTPEAYNAYLQGRYFMDRRTKEGYERAIGYYEKVLQLDPKYSRAWVGLSTSHSSQADRGDVPVDEGYAKARHEVEKALALDPNLAEAYARMGWIKRTYDWDWAGADADYKRSLDLEPANADAVRGAAALASTLGRFDDAIALGQRAIELDPLRIAAHTNLGLYYQYTGRWQEAEFAFRKALELNPQCPSVHTFIGINYLQQSKPEAALAEMQREPEPFWRRLGLALAYHAAGKKKEADAGLAEVIERYQNDAALQIAEIYAYRGETDEAFEWLERAYRQRDTGLSEMKGYPLMRRIENDPRYAEFMKKMKLPL